uniref:Uncharacterized protein n=1 Tax=Thermosporothrix sp. COM3 TaxID=2490863 RepID=A0A455SJU3_9CHLR|nr:hypothetical protein KTC_23320 [Thermosporothrix sp. COM3]
MAFDLKDVRVRDITDTSVTSFLLAQLPDMLIALMCCIIVSERESLPRYFRESNLVH